MGFLFFQAIIKKLAIQSSSPLVGGFQVRLEATAAFWRLRLTQAPTAPAARAEAVRIRVEGSGTAVALSPQTEIANYFLSKMYRQSQSY